MANVSNINVLKKIVSSYFYDDFNNSEIRELLLEEYGIKLSLFKLKGILYDPGLKRKNVVESDLKDIRDRMKAEINGAGKNLGYRGMWLKLKSVHKLIVKRQTVYDVMKNIDPDGLA